MSNFNSAIWNGGSGGGASGELGVASAENILHFAFRALGVLHKAGMGASADSNSEALTWLNWLIDSLNGERLMMNAVVRETLVLTINQQEYTMGDGGDLTNRTRIEYAGLIASGSTTETPLEILTVQGWAGLADKSATGTPSKLYNENQAPIATLYLHPIPTAADTLAIYSWQTLSGFPDLSTQYGFAPGYVQMLGWNLAQSIAPHFIGMTKIPQPLLDRIDREAGRSKARIKSLNAPAHVLKCDAALVGRGSFDILRGDYR